MTKIQKKTETRVVISSYFHQVSSNLTNEFHFAAAAFDRSSVSNLIVLCRGLQPRGGMLACSLSFFSATPASPRMTPRTGTARCSYAAIFCLDPSRAPALMTPFAFHVRPFSCFLFCSCRPRTWQNRACQDLQRNRACQITDLLVIL